MGRIGRPVCNHTSWVIRKDFITFIITFIIIFITQDQKKRREVEEEVAEEEAERVSFFTILTQGRKKSGEKWEKKERHQCVCFTSFMLDECDHYIFEDTSYEDGEN